MPQLIIIHQDLSDSKELIVRQKSFTSGIATVEIDIRDKTGKTADISFFLGHNQVKELIKFLSTEHGFKYDIRKL